MIFMSVNSFVKYCFVCFYNSWIYVHSTHPKHMEYRGIYRYCRLHLHYKKNYYRLLCLLYNKTYVKTKKKTHGFFVYEFSKFSYKMIFSC